MKSVEILNKCNIEGDKNELFISCNTKTSDTIPALWSYTHTLTINTGRENSELVPLQRRVLHRQQRAEPRQIQPVGNLNVLRCVRSVTCGKGELSSVHFRTCLIYPPYVVHMHVTMWFPVIVYRTFTSQVILIGFHVINVGPLICRSKNISSYACILEQCFCKIVHEFNTDYCITEGFL